MADSNHKVVAVERRESHDSDLPSLLERLAIDLTNLLDQKMALLKVEIKEEVDAYVRGAIVILAGGIVAVVGFGLATVALAFAVSTFFSNLVLTQPAKYALGFVVTGLAYLVIGTILVLVTKNRLARQGLVPQRTVKEFERDKEWIQHDIVE